MPGSDEQLTKGQARPGSGAPAQRLHNVTILPFPRGNQRAGFAASRPQAGDGRARLVLEPLGLVLAAAGVVLARATLLDALAPFHLALTAALAVRLPFFLLWAGIPATLTRVAAGGGTAGLADAVTFLLMILYARRLRPEGLDEHRASNHAGMLGLGATLVGGAVTTLLFEPNLFGMVTLAFRTLLAGLLAVLFLRALAPVQRAWYGRLGWSAWTEAWRTGDGPGVLARDEWLSAAVLAAALIAGLQGIHLGPVEPALLLSGLLIMLLAGLGGVGAGAATGAAIAGVAVLNGAMDPVTVAVQAMAGLLAGLFAEYGPVGSAAGYVLGYLLLSAFYRTPDQVLAGLWSVVPAAALFITAGSPGALRSVWSPGDPGDDGPDVPGRGQVYDISSRGSRGAPARRPSLGAAAALARRAPAALARLVPAGRPGEGGGPPHGTALGAATVDGEAQQSCRSVLRRYAALAREMAQAFEQVSPSEERFRQRTLSELVNNLALQVCSGCAHHATCWEREFMKTYQGLCAVLAHRENHGPVTTDHLPPDLALRCPRQRQLATAINGAYELYEVNHRWWRRFDESRRTVSLQLRAVGEVLERVGAAGPELAAGAQRRGAGAVPTLPYRVGVARIAKDEKVVSGDSYMHRQIGDDRLVLVLSDGMGAGTHAAAESRTTVGLLEKLLELGFDETEAVRTVNHLLLLRSTGEMFATLDLALVSLRDGATRFVKIGAAPSFVRRGTNVSAIRAGTLPMGVISEPDIQVARRVLQRGDLVVMLTDGVIGAWEHIAAGEEWVKGFLSNLQRDEPRRVAGDLLREALRRSGGGARDDMTVLVLKLL